MSSLNHTYRFWKRFWRKAECGLCWALTKRPVEHAMWHFNKEEHKEWGEGTVSAFQDIKIYDCEGSLVTERTGWVSTETGPN